VLLVVACVCTVRDDLELVDFEFNDDRRVVRREFDRVVQEIYQNLFVPPLISEYVVEVMSIFVEFCVELDFLIVEKVFDHLERVLYDLEKVEVFIFDVECVIFNFAKIN